jgi:hypothetical protein
MPISASTCARRFLYRVVRAKRFTPNIFWSISTIRLMPRGSWRGAIGFSSPVGLVSVGVRYTRWPLEEYVGLGNGEYFERAGKTSHPSWCKTPLEHINYHFRQYSEHRFAYDLETLTQALVEAGFTNVLRRPFDPSLDSESRRIGTLYVNGQKPVANAR